MLQHTDAVGIFRDTQSGGLVNNDDRALAAYKKKKQAAMEMAKAKDVAFSTQQEVSQLKSDMASMQEDIGQLTSLVKQVLVQLNNLNTGSTQDKLNG